MDRARRKGCLPPSLTPSVQCPTRGSFITLNCIIGDSVLLMILYQLTSVSLQLIFTDGEEAFKHWTNTDSLYGARQLAHDMDQPDGLLSVNGKTGIQAMEAFVLLDLIGSTNPHPAFHDFFQDTTNLFQRFVKIGRLAGLYGGDYPLPMLPCAGKGSSLQQI